MALGSSVCCRDPGDCLSLVAVWSGRIGFQTQKQKSWVSFQVRADRVLAEAITIGGRKEWTCKFSSESNVWTR